jgi:hypothetical protein
VSQHSLEEPIKRMSIHEQPNYEDEMERMNANSYTSRANSVQPQDPYQHAYEQQQQQQQQQQRSSFIRSNVSSPTIPFPL